MDKVEAIKILKDFHDKAALFSVRTALETLHPELAESEDEKMNRELIAYFKNNSVYIKWSGLDVKKVIAWLEKQGGITKLSEEEQNKFAKGVLTSCALSFIDYLDAHKYEGKMCVSNGECEDIENAFHNAMWDRLHRYYCKFIEKQGIKPQGKSALEAIHEQNPDNANKVERKFKVGDFIANDYCKGRVIELTSDAYLLDTEQGIPFSCEHNAHLWTIADAKDGDVLDANGAPFIYKKHDKDYVYFYCGVNLTNEFVEANGIDTWNDNKKVYPATKEQHELLFSKMKEAGYVFDFENKQLKKIENPADWSEENEDEFQIIQKIICDSDTSSTLANRLSNWLQSIKERAVWKPTEEQLYWLKYAANSTSDTEKGNEAEAVLNELYEQLKKL